MKNSRPQHVLAIDPTSHGFGYAVLDSATTLLDWGVTDTRGRDTAHILEKVEKIASRYGINVLVLDDQRKSRRTGRARQLLEQIEKAAEFSKMKHVHIPTARLKKVFKTFGAATKHEIAMAVSQLLPELAQILPEPRKPWTAENYWMSVFDAAALALAHFLGGRPTAKPHAEEN